jgi:uncharacterized protein (TIGR02246 family)
MKSYWPFALVALIVAQSRGSWAQDDAQKKDNAAPPAATAAADPAHEAELKAIRESATGFKQAFDSGDAKAVAALWAKDGEFVDESGRRLQGQEAIEKEFAAFFAANPGAKITSRIEQLRLVNAETAIEDGTDSVEPTPAGAPGKSRYTAVHVKRDGKWQMWSVRETRVDTPSNYGHLEDLEGMIGTWVTENAGVEFEATSHWIADKNFIEQSFKSQQAGETIASGKQIIGWDPASQSITSWVFSADGGHAVGRWHPHETGWLVESVGTLSDGTPTSAVNIISKLDNNAIVWRSVDRTAGAFRYLDTNEVVLKRKPAEKK